MITYQVVLYDLKNLVQVKVVRRFQAAALSAPGQGLTLLAERLKLEEGVVDAIEEHLVVNVLALRVKVLRHIPFEFLRAYAPICCLFLSCLIRVELPLGLPLLLKGQVELEGKHLRVRLIKVLATADLRILELVEDGEGFAGKWLVEGAEEALWVHSDLLMDLIDVALNREQVRLDSGALGAQLCSHLCHT